MPRSARRLHDAHRGDRPSLRPIVRILLWTAAAIVPMAIVIALVVRADRAQEIAAADREAARSAAFVARVVELTAGVGARQLEALADSPSLEAAILGRDPEKLATELEVHHHNPAWLGLAAVGADHTTLASAGALSASDFEAAPWSGGVAIVPRHGFQPPRAIIAQPVEFAGAERAWILGTYSLAEIEAALGETESGGRTLITRDDGSVLMGPAAGMEPVVALEGDGTELRVRSGGADLAAAVVPVLDGSAQVVSLQDPSTFGQQTLPAIGGLALGMLLVLATVVGWNVRLSRAERRLRVRERELAALQELATDTTSSSSRDQVVRMAGARAAQLLEGVAATYVALAVADPGAVLLYATYPAPRDPERMSLDGNAMLGRVLHHGHRESGPTSADDGSWDAAGFGAGRWQVWTPLVAHGRILGAVACLWARERPESAADEERLLDGLAATTAVALESHERLAQLEHQRMMLATMVDASPDALVALDPENRVMLDNPAARAMVRANRTLVGKRLDEILEDAARRGGEWDFDFEPDRLLAKSRAGTTTRGSFRVSFDGSTTAMESVMAPLPLPRGDTGSLVSMRDVSERTELEQVRRLHAQVAQLAREAARRAAVLEQVLAASEMGLVFLDHDGRVAYANDLFGELLGIRKPEIGMAEDDLEHVMDEHVDGAFEDLRTPALLRTPGPGRKILSMRSVEVRDRDDQILGRLISVRDETAQRELDEARESLIGVAAHELKNPLSVLRIQAETGLRDERRAPAALQRILVRTRELQELVDRLLDATRAELGKLALERSDADVAQLVRDAAEPWIVQGADIAIDAEEPVVARVDALRVKQIASNLVSNAVRYGGGGPVSVRVWSEPGEARFSVRDSGAGIPAEEQAQIFERFGQGRSATSGPGLGIGLYLSQRIAAAHGGRIELQSAPGAGSTFTVVLPASPPDYGAGAGTQAFA